MKCRYCGCDLDEIIMIPENPGEVDLTKSLYACRSCGIKNDIFCAKHDRAHQAFGGIKPGNACWGCIDEARKQLAPYAEKAVMLMVNVIKLLPENEQEMFFDEGDFSLISISPSRAEVVFEFLARSLVINRVDVKKFIDKYLSSDSLDPKELANVLSLPAM